MAILLSGPGSYESPQMIDGNDKRPITQVRLDLHAQTRP